MRGKPMVRFETTSQAKPMGRGKPMLRFETTSQAKPMGRGKPMRWAKPMARAGAGGTT